MPLIAVVLVLLSAAGNAQAVSHGHLFTAEVSAEEGCQRAVVELKLEAIHRKCGSSLSGGVLRVRGEQQDSIEHLLFETTAGAVTTFSMLEQQVTPVEIAGEGGLFRCDLEADLEVHCAQGERDPTFPPLQQQIALNQIRYREGETMALTLHPEQPMHITVLQMLPYLQQQERVWRLFPNDYEPDGYILSEVVRTIPDQQRNHYQWVAELPEKRSRVSEELIIVATRSAIPFPKKMSIETFHRILNEIPLQQRRELFIPYQIVIRQMKGDEL